MSIFRGRKGNILIESIVSVSLILIGLLGVFGLITSSVRQNKDVNLRAAAAYLAAEGIEVMKNIVDTDVVSTSSPWIATVGEEPFETYEVEYDTDNSPELAPILLPNGASSTRALVLDNDTGLYRYPVIGGSETPTLFKRTVAVASESPDELRITSVVEWTERGERRSVTLQTIFTNWRTD